MVYHSGTVEVTVHLTWQAPSLDMAMQALKWVAPDATPILRNPAHTE
jgi:hypothetical protein